MYDFSVYVVMYATPAVVKYSWGAQLYYRDARIIQSKPEGYGQDLVGSAIITVKVYEQINRYKYSANATLHKWQRKIISMFPGKHFYGQWDKGTGGCHL